MTIFRQTLLEGVRARRERFVSEKKKRSTERIADGKQPRRFFTGKRLPRSTTTVKENVEKLKLLVQKEVIRY